MVLGHYKHVIMSVSYSDHVTMLVMFSPCLSFFPEFIFSWRVIALQFVLVSTIHQHASAVGTLPEKPPDFPDLSYLRAKCHFFGKAFFDTSCSNQLNLPSVYSHHFLNFPFIALIRL